MATWHVQVLAAGGLLVISAAAQPNERALRQLQGRAARRGDVGQTSSFLCLKDDHVIIDKRLLDAISGTTGDAGAG